MKEICFVRVGDTIKKLNYRLGISIQSKPEKNTVLGYNYLTLKDGSDDIQLVKNYEPYFFLVLIECLSLTYNLIFL